MVKAENSCVKSISAAMRVAENFGLPFLDLESIDLSYIHTEQNTFSLIIKHRMLAIFLRGKNLFLATDDPSKHMAFKEIQFQTGLEINPIVVEASKLNKLIDQIYHQNAHKKLQTYVDKVAFLDKQEIEKTGIQQFLTLNNNAGDDAPIVKLVNQIFDSAIKQGSSDIHFEPYESSYRIRYRQDGLLLEVLTLPSSLAERITARIKVLSNLNIAQRRMPQDGRFQLQMTGADCIDFRVSTCPTIGGEKIVIRILDKNCTNLSIDALGLTKTQKHHILETLGKTQGMMLVTGPTGSGKTVTLYTALSILNTAEKNILTIEDPVEIKVFGINQVAINLKNELTFANALRCFLRQDPDIIMVGEMRCLETAEIAIKAAETGHLVLSTLHTNSAAQTLTRLINMGIPPINIASSINLIIAQRLARRLCEFCKSIRTDLSQEYLSYTCFQQNKTKPLKIYQANGCEQCINGYRGRVGFFEVLPLSSTMTQLILSSASVFDIEKQAQTEGMLTIYQSGIEKVIQGITTIEEVNRVTAKL